MSTLKTFSLIVILHIISAHLSAQINHVAPLNWFVGMKDPNLQLLINGNDIGATTPHINYPGVIIKKVSLADSKNYLFIDLLIAKNTQPGTFDILFKKDGKTIETYPYSLVSRKQDANEFKGFKATDVIYLIVPDRFANGDYSNNVIASMKETKIDRHNPGGRHGGDIRGIINNLDYIKNMGFTAIWTTPLLENDMPTYSYHGYAITNHYKVDPRYGSLDAYKELAYKAKQKGIKLIFDEVLNHCGSGYWWMKDLPFKNWINKIDSFQITTHKRTTNQDVYASKYDKDLMTNGWFDVTMPDLNGQNSFMANYLIQSTIWWIETLQLGGVRQDTYGYSNKTFLKNWSCRIMNEYPNFNIVGEEWSLNPLIGGYWQRGKKNHDGYQSCLPSIMDFPLQSALVDALKEQDLPFTSNGFMKLYEALANDYVYANPKSILVFGDNHDMDRLFTQLGNDVALTKMALTYLLTIRGIPQIFYGTEVLMNNTGNHKNDGLIRSDFPGGWYQDSINAFTGVGLSESQKNMQYYLKQLLNWRKANPVIADGQILHFAPFDGLYVYFRYNKEKTVMVVINKNEIDKSVDVTRFAEILKSKSSALNIITGEQVSIGSTFSVPAKTALVLEVK